MDIDHTWCGRAIVIMGDRIPSSYTVGVTIWPTFALVQPGNGQKYLPEKQLEPGQSYKFDVGDYEFTVKRKRRNHNIISLDERRLRRSKTSS